MSPKPSSRAASSASTSRNFDKELAELEALGEAMKAGAAPGAAAIEVGLGSSPMRRLPARAAPDQSSFTVGGVAHPIRTPKGRSHPFVSAWVSILWLANRHLPVDRKPNLQGCAGGAEANEDLLRWPAESV